MPNAPLQIVASAGPLVIGQLVVPEELADAFLRIAAKPQNFYAGFDRHFLCRGQEYIVHESYDPELTEAGINLPA